MLTRFGRTGMILFAIALYGGPFLAGLARHDWAVLPVFAALLLLDASSARKPDLTTGAGWAGLAMLAATQTGLAGLAWGLGLATAGLVAAVLLPIWAPIALTAVAAGLSAWAMRDAAEMDVMLRSAIEALESPAAPVDIDAALAWPDAAPQLRATLDETLERLRGLDKLNPGVVDPVVQWLAKETGAEAFDAFYDLAGQDGDDNEPEVDYALLRYLAVPGVLARLSDRGEAGLAPQLLLDAPDPKVRAEARARVADLLGAGVPDAQIPDGDRLAGLAAQFPGEGFEHLAAACPRS